VPNNKNIPIIMLLTFILIIISIPSPHHSFIPGLKPSFSANPSHRYLPFFFSAYSTDFPDCLPILLSIPFFQFLDFLFFHFLVVDSVR